MRKSLLAGILSLSLLALAACGSGPAGDPGTGGITATAVWPAGAPSAKAGAVLRKAPAEVAWVRMIVSNGTTSLSADFAAAAGSGSLSSVPAGSGWTLTFQGLDAGKTAVFYEGSKSGLTVTGGATTHAGTVAMYVMPGLAGVIDASFGTGGTVSSSSFPSPGPGEIYGAALQPDGKIVTAGSNGIWMGVARYLASGATDTGLGTGGLVTIPTNSSGSARAVAVQPDGKIVVAGYSYMGSISRFTLSRGEADGTPDGSFGGGTAIVSTPVGTTTLGNNGANAIAVLSNGDIVAAGYAQTVASSFNTRDFALGIYSGAAGTLLSSVTTSFFTCGAAPCNDEIFSLAVQADGKIIAAGVATGDGGENMAVARYTSAGVLDASFNDTGRKAFQAAGSTSCQANAVDVQPDGKIVIGGYCNTAVPVAGSKFALARLNPDGSMDATFNGGNVVVYGMSGGSLDRIHAIKVLPDRKILVGGTVSSPLGGAYTFTCVARFLESGATLDATFNAGDTPGIVMRSFGGTDSASDELSAMLVQSDGRIVVAGKTFLSANNTYALARHWNETRTAGKVYGVEGSQFGVTSTWNSSLSVTSPRTYTVQAPTSTAAALMGISLDTAANRLYVRDSGTAGHKVFVIDTINNMTIGEIAVTAPSPSAGGGIAVFSGTNRAYANNNDGGTGTTVSVIDTSDNSVIATIPGFNAPSGMAYNAASNRLYVANGMGNTVSVVDTVTNAVVSTYTGFTGPNSLSYDASTGKLFVVNGGANTVTAITIATGTRTTMTVGTGPTRSALDGPAQRLYVVNYNGGAGSSVSVINTATSAVIDTITTVAGPRSVRIDSAAKLLYVDCESDQTIHVYDVTDGAKTPVGTLAGGWGNFVVAP